MEQQAAEKIESARMSNPRITRLMEDLIQVINGLVERHQITHDEYRTAVAFLDEAAQAGETMLLLDAFLETDIVEANSRTSRGTPRQVLGPYYLEDAPFIENGQLAAPDEEGDRLTLAGTVRDVDGKPIPGALLDWWQADAKGRYGAFDIPPRTNMNLRGRMHAKEDGSYTLHTVVPAPYTIPHKGPTGRLMEAIGRHPWRPAHVHLRVSHAGYRPLITQIYFQGDKYIESDAVRAARGDLAISLEKTDGGYRATFDVVLE
jgi:catechol 1,2-dioxygenase